MTREQVLKSLKSECNRFVNGQCTTLACMKRGGYTSGIPGTYDQATCAEREAVLAIQHLESELAEANQKLAQVYRNWNLTI